MQSQVAVSSYSIASNVMTLTTASAHGLSVGSRVYIENEAVGANGSYVVTAVGSATTFSFAFTRANGSGSEVNCTAQPVYYAYVQVTNGVPALIASQTGYTVQSNGIATMTGNTALLLVGMFMVNATGFVDSNAYRWCLNWFNRRVRRAAVVGGSTNFTNTTAAEISSTYRARFLMWADDVPQVTYNGSLVLTTSSASSVSYATAVDSITNTVTPNVQKTTNGTWSGDFSGAGVVDGSVTGALTPNEGGHTTILIAAAGANGGTWQISLIQTNVSVFG
jgi:hypothetical protein